MTCGVGIEGGAFTEASQVTRTFCDGPVALFKQVSLSRITQYGANSILASKEDIRLIHSRQVVVNSIIPCVSHDPAMKPPIVKDKHKWSEWRLVKEQKREAQ